MTPLEQVEKIMQDFYFHATGAKDYGCKECKEATTKICSLVEGKENLQTNGDHSETETPNVMMLRKETENYANQFFSIRAKFYDMFQIRHDIDYKLEDLIFKELKQSEQELQKATKKGENLCENYGQALIKIHDLEQEKERYKIALEKIVKSDSWNTIKDIAQKALEG